MYPFVAGSLYTLSYAQPKTNLRIFAFVLWNNPAFPKMHALNLGAKQLTAFDRAKLLRVIAKLAKIPNSSKYNGRVLYRIFKTYLYKETSKCYRTYFRSKITRAALLNYGLNKPEDLKEFEKAVSNREMQRIAETDLFIKSFNLIIKRRKEVDSVNNLFVKTQAEIQAVADEKAKLETANVPTQSEEVVAQAKPTNTNEDDTGYF